VYPSPPLHLIPQGACPPPPPGRAPRPDGRCPTSPVRRPSPRPCSGQRPRPRRAPGTPSFQPVAQASFMIPTLPRSHPPSPSFPGLPRPTLQQIRFVFPDQRVHRLLECHPSPNHCRISKQPPSPSPSFWCFVANIISLSAGTGISPSKPGSSSQLTISDYIYCRFDVHPPFHVSR